MVMMHVTTGWLNILPTRLIPHGSAVNNTFREVSGYIGTAILVTIMATAGNPEAGVEGEIQGVNISFIVAGVISLLGFILSFYVRSPKSTEEINEIGRASCRERVENKREDEKTVEERQE